MDIYDPAEDSYLLQKYVQKHAQGRVLDLGTGLGIQALTAAKNLKVREVIAVDINENAVLQLKTIINSKKIKKIKVLDSDLFSQVSGKFDTIIFNPPYLPQDKGISDPAVYGGKKGWEISERFFSQVNIYLNEKGRILFLFSSLTNKSKIEELIRNNILEFNELEKLKFHFEELYVYFITKSGLLKELERKRVSSLNYFCHGKRGNIFVGVYQGRKVAVKIKRNKSQAVERIKNEVRWLKILNKKNIGPKLLFSGKNYFVYEFVDGDFIIDWIKNNKKVKIKKMLLDVLEQCFILDKLKVNKEELHHPFKHIVIKENNSEPVLLDFERCYPTEKPHNVTQFIDFLAKLGFLKRKEMMLWLQKYKKEINQTSFNKILSRVNECLA